MVDTGTKVGYNTRMNNYRILEEKLKSHFDHYKQAIILLGARQVGKTTLLRKLFPDALYLLADEQPVVDVLESYSADNYRQFIKNHKQILIDEIHLIENPGRAVKIIYDKFPGTQLIITGSSSLHIKNKTAESMAGRAIDYILHPLTVWEYLYQSGMERDSRPSFITDKILELDYSKSMKLYSIRTMLNEVLLYGLYPEVLNQDKKTEYLQNLSDKAIFKDIIELHLIENRSKALELLKVLAYQVGNLINYAEISRKLGLSISTVQRYIDIFEQSFILYRLYPFSKNKRDEIGRSPKIYFWDLGLRNSLIHNFDDIDIRNDSGAMFENFIISEVRKEIAYKGLQYDVHFWRTKSGSEVDLVLSNHKRIIGVEIKLHKGRVTEALTNRYPEAETMVVNSANFL